MEIAGFVIAVAAFIFTLYQYVANKLRRRPRLQVFRFAPESLMIDEDFDRFHVFTDANFIVTNLSDKPNTVIRLDASANLGNGWLSGEAHAKRIDERMRSMTDRPAGGEAKHYNEIVREWVDTSVCPIMLSPQASGIPNDGISMRLDFKNDGPIKDLAGLRLRLELHDQYGVKHSFDVGSRELPRLEPRRHPKFFDDEREIGRLKDKIPGDYLEGVVRVVHRRFEQDLAQSTLSVRRYYPLSGHTPVPHVAHMGRDGYAYNSFRPRDFQRELRESTGGAWDLGDQDGFRFSFDCTDGIPTVLTVRLPEHWTQEKLEVPIPGEFARYCAVEK